MSHEHVLLCDSCTCTLSSFLKRNKIMLKMKKREKEKKCRRYHETKIWMSFGNFVQWRGEITWRSSLWRTLHSWHDHLHQCLPLWSSRRLLRRSTSRPSLSSRVGAQQRKWNRCRPVTKERVVLLKRNNISAWKML